MRASERQSFVHAAGGNGDAVHGHVKEEVLGYDHGGWRGLGILQISSVKPPMIGGTLQVTPKVRFASSPPSTRKTVRLMSRHVGRRTISIDSGCSQRARHDTSKARDLTKPFLPPPVGRSAGADDDEQNSATSHRGGFRRQGRGRSKRAQWPRRRADAGHAGRQRRACT